jgi:transposase-like protein
MAQKGKRRQHSPEFKARVALAAAAGDKSLAELAAQFDLHPTVISTWKNELLENAALLFGKEKRREEGHQKTVDALYREIGRLKVENDFLASLPVARAGRSGQK